MKTASTKVFWATPVNPRPLEPGTMLRVELDQYVDDRGKGPHPVGHAEVGKDGVLKLALIELTKAGRDAAAMLAEGITDVVLHGSKPVVRLTRAQP